MNTAEQLFHLTMLKQGCVVRKATREEDMFKHFDYVCDGVKYDVKDQKKLNRWDKEASDIIWIELKNVRGDRGWVKGEADKIAFLTPSGFLIVDRKALYMFVVDNVKDHTIHSTKGHLKLYRRSERLDIVTYVYPEDIAHLIEKTIPIK